MLRRSKRAAVRGFSSTLSLATRTRPAISAASSSMTGAIILQGPHHPAHASTRTGTGERSTSAENVASVTVRNPGDRLIAALDRPDTGEVLVNGQPVSHPGRDRGMVFQKYTSFPWLTVAQNVEYGLKINGVPAAERATTVAKLIRDVLDVTLVPARQDHLADAHAVRGQHLLLDPAHGQHLAAQGDLARHRQVAPDGTSHGQGGQRRHDGHAG